ncbi:MAG: PD-(D/E)XK nuclease family protein [Gammaproteobacteria bacterium]|nr:PD-(D/E)XK nuclease family protein [Gammaproteobacteria bacterium]
MQFNNINNNINFNKYSQTDSVLYKKILLVPNQRLARKLTTDAINNTKFKTPVISGFSIYPLNDFINNIHSLLLESGLLESESLNNTGYYISPWQREILFKIIIENYIASNNDFSSQVSPNLYKKAIQAWQLIKQWQLEQDYENTIDSNIIQPEIKVFKNWIGEYKKKLSDLNYIDPDDKLVQLVHAIDPALIQLLKLQEIDLYGFDDLAPIYKKLFNNLASNNIVIQTIQTIQTIDYLENSHLNKKLSLFTAQDIEQEVAHIVDWAYEHYVNNITDIGIIVPNLSQYRGLIYRKFTEKFVDREAWNISGGEPLADLPIIKSGVILLELLITQNILLEDLIYFLQTHYYLKYPILNSNTYQNVCDYNAQTSNLLAEIKYLGYKELSLNDFLYFIKKINLTFAELVSKYNKDFFTSLKLPSEWAVLLFEILTDLGWPSGSHSQIKTIKTNIINSQEYQAIRQFQNCCYKLAELDKIYGSVKFKKIFHDIKNLLLNTPFQIETSKNTIDILGMLEGAGLSYNKLWITGLTSEVWPSSPDPNPFIPIELQKKYHLPHSTVDREFEYAKRLTSRYLASSEDIVISYPLFEGEKEFNLSLLIDKKNNIYNKLNNDHSDNYSDNYSHQDKHQNKQNILTEFSDEFGPAITSHHIKSGIKALSLQTICPFKAFAEIRLNAVDIYNLDIGPASWLRGQVIHEILQYLYTEFNNKIKLENFFNNKDYNNYLAHLILEILHKYKLKYFNIYKLGIIQIEQEIMFTMLDQLIQLELTRDDFNVLAVEESCLFKIENLQFHVRIDRIDQLPSGELLIIDYKTSRQNINNLFGDELTEPQLPIYLFLDNYKNIQAVVFSEILYQHSSYSGVGNNLNLDGCINISHWEELKVKWHQAIATAAKNFTNGEAGVRPINKSQTCHNCHLGSFCRKGELCL